MFKRITAVFTLTLLALIPLFYLNQLAAGQETEDVSPIPPFIPGIPLSNNNEGRINTTTPMLFGPDICTAFGDSFSPHNSVWAPGSYTYPYRIRIPADYPHDRVRVELFDPDSINKDENSDHIIFSDLAQSLNPTQFPPGTHLRTCSGYTANRKNACRFLTGELTLVGSHRDLTIELINPFWFVRVDENRGTGTPGQCGEPFFYTPSRNTTTLYELYYYAADGNGNIARVSLAAYTGQTGDGIRDQGDHDTDLRWVSPGGPTKFDQPVFVPADNGSFVVDLNQDTPNLVVDPVTGERSLYLDVTALSGASENGFAIWAGPDHYVNVPSNVNSRNLHLLNNPDAHDSAGVRVEAVDNLPNNINATMSLRMPLAELGPEYTGQTIFMTHFDLDAGTRPPLVFHIDRIAFTPDTSWDGVDWAATDWALSFGGAVDPDGRCFSGGASYNNICNDQWVNPAYTITLPTEQDCDYDTPTSQSCTPFYGGRLMTTFRGGAEDSHVWRVHLPETPATDPSLGCSAFPIGVQQNVRSVLPPGQPGGANTWPTIFNYPNPAPVYDYFRHHRPDVPLLEAQPGDVFKLTSGVGEGQFAWLAWNVCQTSSADLVESLAWPGNSRDYRPLLGDCTLGGFGPRVRGYVEPGNPDDREMHLGDWVTLATGTMNNFALQQQLNQHIDLGRTLRLLVWDASTPPGSTRIARFALFRIVGYNSSMGQNWLMLEFRGWDESCGQLIAPDSLALTGPVSGEIDVSYAITAVLSPTNSTPPLHYTWTATDHDPITYNGTPTETRSFLWTEPGLKSITVTVQNDYGLITATHTITIAATVPSQPILDLLLDGPAVGEIGWSYPFTATVMPADAAYPISYTWWINGQTPISRTNWLSDTITIAWATPGTKVITVEATNASTSAPLSQNHVIEILPWRLYLPFLVRE